MMQGLEPDNHTGGQSYQELASLRSRTAEAQGSASGSAQATSSDAGPAMFDSATNTMINDGHFTTHQGDHTSVTINIHGPRIPGTSDGIRNQPSTQNVAPNLNTQRNPNRFRRRRLNRPGENMIRPVQRSNEIYERHLMLKGRGFPLWIPQPNMRLPIPYRAKGVCIGDVGIVTNFGGFDFLFNICRARDDPINPEELPDNFTPIHPPLSPSDVREFREFSSGSYLASSSVVESQTAEQTLGLTFESSASEGAILTMPEGAFQEELSNLSKFRNYVALHATDWYKFVNGPRGREAQNGDLRVVVGCDKTTTWGMATFANTSSAQQSKFRLKFRPLGGQQQPQHNAGSLYAWEHSGVAEVRVGPEPGENEELGETPTGQFRNQCLFMRTLSVTLSDSLWAATFPETVSSINQEGSKPEYRGQYLRPPKPNTAKSRSSSSFNPARFVQGTRRSLGPSKSVAVEGKDNNNEAGPTPIQDVQHGSSSARWGPTDGTRDSDDIIPEVLNATVFVDKLYRIVNDPEVEYVTWTDSGASFIIRNVQIIESLGLSSPSTKIWDITTNFSDFMSQLHLHGFYRINWIHHSMEETWEISHPKFLRGRTDLLHEIKLAFRLDPSRLQFTAPGSRSGPMSSMQIEDMRMWDNPSKIINKYLLEQVPHAKIALTHDRDWSYVAERDFSYLDPSKLIKEVTSLNNITVDIDSGIVFLEPQEKIVGSDFTGDTSTGRYLELLPTVEESASQFERRHITIEQYLFKSNENHSTILLRLISQLQSDYMSFRHQYTMPARLSPLFLTGHPKRLLSLDDFIDLQRNNITSLLKRHHINSVRSELSVLPLQHSGRGTWLLRLADALSRRFWNFNNKHDLEEAISYYKEAMSLLPQTHYHFLEAILGLCSSLYQRFQLLGHSDDIRELLEHLHTELDLDLKSVLAPVKAQLPRQVIRTHPVLKSLKSGIGMMGVKAPVTPSIIDREKTEATLSKERTRGRTSRSSRRRGDRALEFLDLLHHRVHQEPESRSQEAKGHTNDQSLPLAIPVQNTSLHVADEMIQDEV